MGSLAAWMVDVTSATPATRNERQCHQAPRLPCKVARRPGLKRAQARHQGQPSAISAIRWWVTKWCVKDGVCDKVVCERSCV